MGKTLTQIHVEHANMLLKEATDAKRVDEADRAIAAAHVQATLAEVEQSRIANLIRWFRRVDRQGDMPDVASDLADQIEDGLGLS